MTETKTERLNLRTMIEGIFEVQRWSERPFGVSRMTRTTQGTLLTVCDKEQTYHSTAFATNETKTVKGSELEIQTERGTAKVYFPIPITPTDQQALLQQQIRYSHAVWNTNLEGTEDTYTLEPLSGALTGQKFQRKVFV